MVRIHSWSVIMCGVTRVLGAIKSLKKLSYSFVKHWKIIFHNIIYVFRACLWCILIFFIYIFVWYLRALQDLSDQVRRNAFFLSVYLIFIIQYTGWSIFKSNSVLRYFKYFNCCSNRSLIWLIGFLFPSHWWVNAGDFYCFTFFLHFYFNFYTELDLTNMFT